MPVLPVTPRRQSGFTLIELVAVVSILGILAAIAIPQFHQYVKRSEDAAVKIFLAEIGSLQRDYNAVHGKFVSCPANPAQSGAGWQAQPAWQELGFDPMQELYGYQLKVEATETSFRAVALKGGKEVYYTSNTTYDIKEG